jgi:hypothetical protein
MQVILMGLTQVLFNRATILENMQIITITTHKLPIMVLHWKHEQINIRGSLSDSLSFQNSGSYVDPTSNTYYSAGGHQTALTLMQSKVPVQ